MFISINISKITKVYSIRHFFCALLIGIEPTPTEPESVILPLDERSICCRSWVQTSNLRSQNPTLYSVELYDNMYPLSDSN